MSEKVEFIRGNDRISQLAQRPDIAAEVAQVELARRMGVTQAAISRMEQPHDLLLSTLNSYLQAIGGTARMIVRFADGHEALLDLGQLA
jgi:predicted transcriptional regulator